MELDLPPVVKALGVGLYLLLRAAFGGGTPPLLAPPPEEGPALDRVALTRPAAPERQTPSSPRDRARAGARSWSGAGSWEEPDSFVRVTYHDLPPGAFDPPAAEAGPVEAPLRATAPTTPPVAGADDGEVDGAERPSEGGPGVESPPVGYASLEHPSWLRGVLTRLGADEGPWVAVLLTLLGGGCLLLAVLVARGWTPLPRRRHGH